MLNNKSFAFNNFLDFICYSSIIFAANTGVTLRTAGLLAGDANFEDSLIVEGNKIRIRRDSHLEGDQGHSRTSILFSGTESAALRKYVIPSTPLAVYVMKL